VRLDALGEYGFHGSNLLLMLPSFAHGAIRVNEHR